MSRWHSLQCAEKFLKAFLSTKVAGFEPKKFNHNVERLAREAAMYGCPAITPALLAPLSFGAAVRYNEVPSTADEALQAHFAARKICTLVANAVTKAP